jgi:hypothetical protein
VVTTCGLASRRYASYLPGFLGQRFLGQYAGDTLWALLVYIVIAFARPAWPALRLAAAAFAVSCLVEISQLYHAPWIDGVRATALGGLVLGFGFLWSDIACYAVGVLLGALFDRSLHRPGRRS